MLRRDKKFRHTILKTVARAHELSFVDYVTKATTNLVNSGELEFFTEEELTDPKIQTQLDQWWEVVTFYTLRLAMAPIIGTRKYDSYNFCKFFYCFRDCDSVR